MTAAILGTQLSYIAFTFLPPILWLVFYLRQDRHPEPKRLIILTFFAGMGAAIAALIGECAFVSAIGGGSCAKGFLEGAIPPPLLFLGIAFIEEYLKYAAVRIAVLKRSDFDEPIDAMIYLMTAAMGFAALENALFLLPVFQKSFASGIVLTTNRFLGANLLHALASGIVGFFLARAWFHPRRHHFVALGVLMASLLHAIFNYLILIKEDVPEGTLYIIFLLSLMASIVFLDFARLKKTADQ